MICYLLFPEVLFHFIDKMWESKTRTCTKDSYGVDTHFSIYFLNHFPTLSMPFLLFVSVVFVFETQPVIRGRGIYISDQSERENLLRAVCLLPRALVWGPVGEKKTSILGNPAKIALQIVASYLEVTSRVLGNVSPTTAVRSRTVANICTIVTCPCCTKSFWEGKWHQSWMLFYN